MMLSSTFIRPTLAAVVWLAPPPAFGFIVLQESFDQSDEPNFASNSNWEESYCHDSWRTDLNAGVVAASDNHCLACGCDFNVESAGPDNCLYSDPFDNHIQIGNPYWENYQYSVSFRNADDDAVGVIFRYSNPSSFYLFVLSRDQMPNPLTGCDEQYKGARLMRVAGTSGVNILKSSPDVTYTPNTVHLIRVTVVSNHLKVEFDQDGDGLFADSETFFDGDDDPALALPAGRVGLYAYENGVQEHDGAPSPCASKGCWFDDVTVDLFPPTQDKCEGVAWEGACDGNTLIYCDMAGMLHTVPCGEKSCCRWVPAAQIYACVPSNQCGSNCSDACTKDTNGCSSNLSHYWYCAENGDDDKCLEPVFSVCPEDTVCNPTTGKCQVVCKPNCATKECGDDGCGGSCGSCPQGKTCKAGICVSDGLGKLGDPCQHSGDCVLPMCIELKSGSKICSKACLADTNCPGGFECSEAIVGGVVVLACVPSAVCNPSCAGKECGDDGCGGSCGECPSGFECVESLCRGKAGASCLKADDCATGLCIPFQSGNFCTDVCSSQADCPKGWFCQPWLSASAAEICGPPSTLTAYNECSEIAKCISGCATGVSSCVANCFFLGTSEARQIFALLWICSELSCFPQCAGNDSCVQECVLASCFQEFASCYPGELSCKATLDCMASCPTFGTACRQECFDKALPVAKKQLMELASCLQELCHEGDADCIAQAIAGPCKELYEACSSQCTPLCDGKVCGTDGCGGSCGECPLGETCESGACVPACTPSCVGKECGFDGCSGSCGECPEGSVCIDGLCHPESECGSHAFTACFDGELYWFDFCGRREDMAEDCEFDCVEDKCISPVIKADVSDIAEEPRGEAVMLRAKGPSTGCSASASPHPSGIALFLLFSWCWRSSCPEYAPARVLSNQRRAS